MSAFTPAEMTVRADRAARRVVVELLDDGGDGFALAIEPDQALDLALKIAAAVSRLRGLDQ